MQTPPSKTESDPNTLKAAPDIKNPQHLSTDRSKLTFKIKSYSPLDGTSNLEFTNPTGKSLFPMSLANIRPDQHSYTVHKIHQNTKNLNKNPIRRPNLPEEKENTQRVCSVLKEISSVDNEIPLFKIWPGNNRFYFNGRLMTGPKTDKFPNCAAWGLFLGGTAIYFASALPQGKFATLTNILIIYLFLLTLIFFFLTSFTDPGIIPRKCVWELNGEVPKPYCGTQRKDSSCTTNHSSEEKPVQNSEKFCTICNIHQPLRTIHCKHCGNCVEESRGHIRAFNNCIGKRNYQFFVGFITSMVLLNLCYITCFILSMIQSFVSDLRSSERAGAGFYDSTIDTVIGYIAGIPTVIFFFIKLFLFLNHLFIKARRNANQNQDQRKKEKQGIIFKDIRTDWCSTEPSKVNPRQLISRAQLQKYKANLVEGQNEV